MRRMALGLAVLLAVFIGQNAYADPLVFDYSSQGNSEISFDGAGHFSFVDSTNPGPGFGLDFQIASQEGPSWPSGNPGTGLLGLYGHIGNPVGGFTIGTVTTPFTGVQVAPVFGVGAFEVFDSSNVPLTATLRWLNAVTIGTSGALDFTGKVNLTNMTYGGTNVDLLAFAGSEKGTTTVTFQFIPPRDLSYLKTHTADNTYSGTATSVPEPGSMLLLGSAMLGLAGLRLRRKSN